MSVKIGDVVEIKTAKGLAYAVHTHRHSKPPTYGALLRVLDGFWTDRPKDLHELVKEPIRFSTFFPLQAAVNRKLVNVVGNVEVPAALQAFPTFRAGAVDPRTKKVAVWWLWDGERQWKVGELTPEQRRLPIEGIWNDTMLVKRIEDGWRPETDKR